MTKLSAIDNRAASAIKSALLELESDNSVSTTAVIAGFAAYFHAKAEIHRDYVGNYTDLGRAHLVSARNTEVRLNRYHKIIGKEKP